MSSFISFENVEKRYGTGEVSVQALHDASFIIEKGEICVIVGPSGAGKTTLLNILGGMDTLTSGQVFLDGREVSAFNSRQLADYRRRDIGFVFQSYNLLPQYSALENVAMPLALRGMPKKEREEEAMKMLTQVGLAEHAEHKPSELSGGQQQRVGIARAIITAPEIVFADEPTGNLDTKTGEEVMELLKKIFKERNTTFILVSHDPDMRRYAGREIHIQDGIIRTEESVISGGKVI